MNKAGSRAPPLARTIFRGAVFLGLMRFAIRLLGFVSVTVTARLLTPADFGVIGTAAIVTGFFAVLAMNGIGEALTRLRALGEADLHTAWTLNLIVAGLIGAAVFLAAGPAAGWLGEPKLTAVLHHLAFMPLLGALASPATLTLLRDLRFREEFRLRVVQKVLLVVAVIAGAALWRDYWGLVYGQIAGTLLGVAASYLLAPLRPRLSLGNAAYYLSFSFWTTVQALGAYVGRTADEIAVRRIADTATFGLYHVSRDLSRIFVAESVAPASAALLPGLARLQDQPERFARAAVNALGVGAIVAIAVGFGLAATAPEAVVLLLGWRWAEAAQFLAIVAIGSTAGTMVGMHRPVMVALGRVDLSAKLALLRAALMLGGCLMAASVSGVRGVAMTYAGLWIAWYLFDSAILCRLLGRPRAVVGIMLRPLLAGLAMVLALWALPWPADLPLLALALLKVALGGAVYGGALALLWWARGRPDGPEATLLEQIPRGLGRRLLPAARARQAG